jgi:hypothetical protein
MMGWINLAYLGSLERQKAPFFVYVDLHINSCGTTKPAKAQP